MSQECAFVITGPEERTCTRCGRVVHSTYPPDRCHAVCSIGGPLIADIAKPCTKRWYRTTDLIDDTQRMLSRVPSDISRVVGVPRSGMIPATIIASHLHLPLYAIHDNEIVSLTPGHRMADYQERPGRALLVEDSVGMGRRMALLSQSFPINEWVRLAVYVLPRSTKLVDIYAKTVPAPHLFEWNFFNAPFMRDAALDMDGVICRDGTEEPLYVPRNIPAKAIITARSESQRVATVAWLKRHGARYNRLVMWPGKPDGRNLRSQAEWKAGMMREVAAEVYVESCPHLAAEMRKRGIRVLCPDEGVLK